MKEEKVYFRNLDSIRFIAALMVFLSHEADLFMSSIPQDYHLLKRIIGLLANGGTGVSIFFVLSGFLITYLLISEYEWNGSISIRKFYIRRILRIWPLFYSVVIFGFFVYPILRGFSSAAYHAPQLNVFYHLAFLSNFDVLRVSKFLPGQDIGSISITWSVSVEEQFYLFWPLIFYFLPKRGWVVAIIGVIFLSVCFRLAHHNDHLGLYYHTMAVIIDMAMGALAAYLIKTNHKVRSFFESASTLTHFSFFLLALNILFWKDSFVDFKYATALVRIFTSISFALIISAQALTKKDSLLNLGKISFANYWGKYTYGIYLLHLIVLRFFDIIIIYTHLDKNDIQLAIPYLLLTFGAALGLSWLSYQYFESRFLALKSRFEIIKTIS